MHDIFYIGKKDNQYNELKKRFLTLKQVETVKEAQTKCLTDLFWVIWNDLEVNNTFDFSFVPEPWDKGYVHQFKNADFYDGICLIPKEYNITDEEILSRVFKDKKFIEITASKPKKYDIFVIDSYEDYEFALQNTQSNMFWATSNNINTEDFNFDLYFDHSNLYDRTQNHAFIHRVHDTEQYNGVFLLTTSRLLSRKEIEHRFLVDKKEWDIVASGPVKYDTFIVDTYDDYVNALETSSTEMFWALSNNIKTDENFDFDLYFNFDNTYDRNMNHVFIHRTPEGDFYNGVFLFSKHKPVTEREITHRHIVERKEWDIVASGPVQYDIFTVDSYEDYLEALDFSKTELFWATSKHINIDPDFNFDLYFNFDNTYDRNMNHVFIHRTPEGDFYNGLFLFSKNNPVSQKEIEHRHIVERKEWDIVASGPLKYDVFTIDSYEDYETALKTTSTELFWATGSNLKVDSDFNFDLYFNFDNEYDRYENHAFIHRVEEKDYYNGIFLFSIHKPVTKREIEHRHLVDRKEWNIVASGPCVYDKFIIENYDDYLYALEHSNTEMFWALNNNIKIDIDFNFDVYFNIDNEYDRHTNHAFVHRVNGEDYYNGLFLFSKYKKVTEREIEHRHLVDRKAWDIVASGPTVYDIFTIDTYEDYLYALENSNTEMFWGKSVHIKIDEDFHFDFYVSHNEYDRKENHAFIHRVDGEDYYNGLFLFSKYNEVVKKEIEHRHLLERKEWDIVASGPVVYDKFIIETYEDYQHAIKTTNTEMFWMLSHNLKVDNDFHFNVYFTHNNDYDRFTNHAFIHRVDGEDLYNGIFLLSKHVPITEREIEHRHLVDRKEWNIVASGPCVYDKFIIETYEDYQHAMEETNTELFWALTHNAEIDKDFNFEVYFPHHNEYDRYINHVFVHRIDGEDLYNGIFLLSKHVPLVELEINHRHIIDRKEWDIVASGPCVYDKFYIETYKDYLYAVENSNTEMFWGLTHNAKINDDFNFEVYFPHHNEYDRNQNHAFIHRVDGEDLYNGIFLLSKTSLLTEREITHRHLVERKEWNIVASGPVQYDIFTVETYKDYLYALENSKTEMFWMSSSNIQIDPDFNFDIYFTHENEYDRHINHAFIHRVDGEDLYNGLFLMSKHRPVTEREIEHRHLVDRKEWDIVASGPCVYDKFIIETYEDYQRAMETSNTEMFWALTPNVKVNDDFNFDIYFTHENEYDRYINHTFIHRVDSEDYYNGIFLLSKHIPLTEREITHRHLVERKEWNIVASGPVVYDKFIIETFDDYIYALDNTTTEMFWALTPNVKVSDDFTFELYFTHDNEYDRHTNHSFIHRVNGEKLYNGIFLLSKHKVITEREIEHRHLVDNKEWNITASGPCIYDKFYVETYEDYQRAMEITTTEMFWALTPNIKINDDFDFGIYFSHNNEHDRHINHVFAHEVDGVKYYNGLFLLSKHVPITEREITHRHLVERKEWDVIASGPVEYNRFKVNSYEDYLYALENTTTEMFWIIPDYVYVDPDFNFDTYFTHDNEYDRHINHAYLNGKYHDGVYLCSKYSRITKREFEYHFVSNKKEVDVVASTPKDFDIVFISYQEPNCDENYAKLLERFPNAKRIHGVKGIHQAHIEAAKLCKTDMFWIIDGDAELVKTFDLDYQVARWDIDTVHVWRSKNPINNLVYGYGGVKLFPRLATINMDTSKPDMTTSISDKFKPVSEISNITAFNTDPFNTWKSAFRECTKLSSKIIDRQKDEETLERLEIWKSVGADKPYGEYAIAGAIAGALYGEQHKGDVEALKKINDFDWLKEQFNATQK